MRIQISKASLARCVPGRRWVRILLALVAILCLGSFILYSLQTSPFEDMRFYDIKLQLSPAALNPPRTVRPNGTRPSPFRQVRGLDLFLYSAVANEREPSPGEVNLIISAFDASKTDTLVCCVVVASEDRLYTTRASVYYKFYVEEILGPVQEWFLRAPTKVKQYACVVPQLGIKVTHVTLTTSVCPVEEREYLPVIYPHVLPQGLALCAKAAFGDKLDPEKLMEWFEVQRLLGVDHIQIMDLNNPEPIQKVFRYYTQMGLLNALPYQLPGPPYGRGLDWKHWKAQQASHDETFPILDCKQRLRGYTYVMGHDMDEVLMPARHQSIKDLMKEQLMKYPDAAGFFFYTQFFVYDWGPQNKDSDVDFFRFLNSTLPRNECKKYVYISNRVEQARTHTFFERSPYQKYFVSEEDAILHHYRDCPKHVWSTCNPPRMTDRSMLRFQGVMEERLRQARKATGLYPKH